MRIPNVVLRRIDQNKTWPEVARRFRRLETFLRVGLVLAVASACGFAILATLIPGRRLVFGLLLLLSLLATGLLAAFRKIGRDGRREFGAKLEIL
jgi:hypothetical protein